MAEVIASDLDAAWKAISGIKNVPVDEGMQFTLSCNVIGMVNGSNANSHMMPDLRELVECVQKQAEKFFTLAEKKEEDDKEDASEFNISGQ